MSVLEVFCSRISSPWTYKGITLPVTKDRTVWVCICPFFPFSWPPSSAGCCQASAVATSDFPPPPLLLPLWDADFTEASDHHPHHYTLHWLPCQVLVQSQVCIAVQCFPSKWFSSPNTFWHMRETQFMHWPFVGRFMSLVLWWFISDSRMSISLILWDFWYLLSSLWSNDQ